MEMTGEMLYRMWLDCSAAVAAAPAGNVNTHLQVGAVALSAGAELSGGVPAVTGGAPPWEELTPQGRQTFDCMARKLEQLAE
jgi:hypothetical protein